MNFSQSISSLTTEPKSGRPAFRVFSKNGFAIWGNIANNGQSFYEWYPSGEYYLYAADGAKLEAVYNGKDRWVRFKGLTIKKDGSTEAEYRLVPTNISDISNFILVDRDTDKTYNDLVSGGKLTEALKYALNKGYTDAINTGKDKYFSAGLNPFGAANGLDIPGIGEIPYWIIAALAGYGLARKNKVMHGAGAGAAVYFFTQK